MVARNTVRFPLGAGIDRKSDDKHVPVPKCEILQNVELRATGKIRKRRALKTAADGSAGDVATLVGGGQRYLVNADSTYGEVIRAQGSTYDAPSLTAPVSTSVSVLARKAIRYRYGQCATFGEKLGLVTQEARNTPESVAMEIDVATGNINTPGYPADRPAVSDDVRTTRLLNVPGHGFLMVWAEEQDSFVPDDINAQLYIDGAFQDSITTLVSADLSPISANAPGIFDAVVDATGDKLWVAYQDNALDLIVVDFDITGTGASITITATGNSQSYTLHDPTKGISVCLDTDNSEIVILHSGDGGNVILSFGPDDLMTSLTNLGVGSAATVSSKNVDCVYMGGGNVSLFYHDISTGTTEKVVEKFVNTPGSVTPHTREYHGCRLIHRAVAFNAHGTNAAYVGVVRALDLLEPMYITLMTIPTDASHYPTPVASYQYTTASVDYPDFNLSSVAEITTDTGTRFFWSQPIRTEIRSAGVPGAVVSNLAAALHSFDLSAEKIYNHDHGHAAMIVAGSIPMAIVGNPVSMAGHLSGPIILSAVGASGGALTIDGTFSAKAVYEFVDQRGRIWQSRPSVASVVTLGSGEFSIDLEITTPVVPFSDLRLGVTVQIAVYVTSDGGTSVHYRDSAYSRTKNDFHTELSESYTINNDPLETEEILYTDAALLEHFPPPPCTTIVKHKNRFAAVHSETGDIWFSTEFTDGQGVFWHPQLSVKVDDPSDQPTALVSTDSALMVLYKNRMGYIYGDGPNNQGLGQPFTNVQFLPDADVGSISQKTVLKLPMGAFFCDADKGFHVVPYGGAQPQYVGRDLDGSPTEVIIGMAHLPDRHEARVVYYNAEQVVAADGEAPAIDASWHTWHYDTGDWSHGLATGYTSANRYALSDGNEFLIDGTGEKASNGYDATSTYVVMRIRTGWIVLEEASRKQGQFRLWNIYCLTETVDDHDLNVDIYYDYDIEGDASSLDVASRVAGEDRLKIWPGRQLIEAFKLDIFDAEDAGNTTTGEGHELSDIEIHFGVYPGIKPRVAPGDIVAGS